MDKVECAGRILARALGYGRPWSADIDSGSSNWRPVGEATPSAIVISAMLDDDPEPSTGDDLPVCRESETTERAGDSVSAFIGRRGTREARLTPEQRKARAKLSPDQCEELWGWEQANPLHAGQQGNPRRPRELEHWKRGQSGAGVRVVRPRHRMDTCSLRACAGLPKPLEAILTLYATGDVRQWEVVLRYARACLRGIEDDAIAEGMLRLLTEPAKRTRAKECGMRESAWDRWSIPALRLFDSWLERAADAFLSALERESPMGRSDGDALRSETWWHPHRLSADVRGGPPASPRA